ncbi:MAG: type III-A CRISPR-associated protein Csm2 [Gemmatimonadetes bacterium]|nr:type III-A CRISPR-associated protein Csm2 [Gemmatimonadota bacterium]
MNQHRDRGRPPPRPQQGGQRPPPARQDQGGQRPAQEIQHVEQLWPDYLRGGYFDQEGNLCIEYVRRKEVEPLVREMARARPALSQGQLRRFFQHCRRIEARLKAKEASWPQVQVQVTMLDSAAQDAHGKSPPKIPALFADFLRHNVEAISSEKDFLRGFLPHFEALVGFGSVHIRSQGN